MKRTYQDVVNRIKEVANAHSGIYSVDDGRDLEFDVKKKHEWPRFFIKTVAAPILGGPGTVELGVDFVFLLMGRVNIDRSDIVEVMNTTHSAMTDVLATLSYEQIIRKEDLRPMTPLYDYQDTQTSGWQIPVRAYIEKGFECYTVD
jgi:hypothetical protein